MTGPETGPRLREVALARRGDEPGDAKRVTHGDLLSLDDWNLDKRRVNPLSRQSKGGEVSDEKPEITAFVNEEMPLGATLGIRTFGGPDEIEATLDWAPGLCTSAGVLHGGVLMALADSAGGVCAHLNLPPGARTATIESKTNFFAAIRGGEIRARTRPLHRGKTTIVLETDLFDARGRLVGRTTQTQAVLTDD
jgi:1,4-dihydroxy-2-naphthoyl-CoA hydrolase